MLDLFKNLFFRISPLDPKLSENRVQVEDSRSFPLSFGNLDCVQDITSSPVSFHQNKSFMFAMIMRRIHICSFYYLIGDNRKIEEEKVSDR